jgi:formylglycine-generating enzyme
MVAHCLTRHFVIISGAIAVIASCSHPIQSSHGVGEPALPSEGRPGPVATFQSATLRRESAAEPTQTIDPAAASCPESMVLVEGDYCPEVEQKCLQWLDPPGTMYAHFRCARYASPSVCKSARVHKRFCIDRTERAESQTAKPRNFVSFNTAKDLCREADARVCLESEWQFACEGEEMRPYPYGFERDPAACNTDISSHLKERGRLRDHRAAPGSHERCKSPFGVMDLAGNMEEWVAADGHKQGFAQIMKGSWWIPSRHACRQFQIGHGPEYGGAETGTRCCKDVGK